MVDVADDKVDLFKGSEPLTIAIIGGGFSGCLTAVNLLRNKHWRAPVKVILVDNGSRIARGLAYGTVHSWHYLNVHSGNMSALPDEPDSLVDFLKRTEPQATWRSFITRKRFGEYIQSLLEEIQEQTAGSQQQLALIAGTVTAIGGGGAGKKFLCTFETGATLAADVVVLALGNAKPTVPGGLDKALAGGNRLIADSWDHDWKANIAADDTVLFVGTGLTMIDKALELEEQGHRGKMFAVSRHGLLPQRHDEKYLVKGAPPLPEGDAFSAKTVREALRWVRSKIATAPNWRLVVDSLRPYGYDWWQSLNLQEKRRFFRHVAAYWDVHRHRMAPEVAAHMQTILDAHKLAVVAGRIEKCEESGGKAQISIRERGTGALRSLGVDRVINCTGAEARVDRVQNKLMSALYQQGWISANELKAGLDVNTQLRVIDAEGKVRENIFALGPPLRGAFFETIAVPELRKQAVIVAQQIFDGVH